jgi:exopolysaccharide biosynthesis WecB/TagA/CpsF family protein
MNKKNPTLFGVRLPQTTLSNLKKTIKNLPQSRKRKQTLYFHYSEFLLRANRNQWYKYALNRGDITAIDGKGLGWAMWSVMDEGIIAKLYKLIFIYFPRPLRELIFVCCFILQLCINFITGCFTLVFRINLEKRTKNEVILGRDFVYDLLTIAQNNGWKTLIVGGSSESDEFTNSIIKKIFPALHLVTWSRSYTSLLMKDQVLPEFVGQTLNSINVCQFFPDLQEAKQFIKKEKPELVLVCLGGASGRQEFFVDNLKLDPHVDFLLATGLGAAIDHLGRGAKQQVAPKWMIATGLEWLFRFITQPYRRKRIWDSIFTLWWWTTVQQFTQKTQLRPTVINILSNSKNEILLVKRRNVLPGDNGWTFVQGGIDGNELPETAGIREIKEEVKLEKHFIKAYLPAIYSGDEEFSVSFMRFLLLGAKYEGADNYLNFVEYTGAKNPSPNWENQEAKWVSKKDVETYLSVEKIPLWKHAQKILEESGFDKK